MVEASMVIPLVVLIVAGMISCSFTLMDRVQDASEQHIAQSDEMLASRLFTTEDILRIRWTAKE